MCSLIQVITVCVLKKIQFLMIHFKNNNNILKTLGLLFKALLQYLLYILGQTMLSKQSRPRSDAADCHTDNSHDMSRLIFSEKKNIIESHLLHIWLAL